MELNKTFGNVFLKIARDSIESYLNDENSEPQKENYPHNELDESRGVFVTLHKNKELRGCIGYPYPVLPLFNAIVKAARGAAFGDPRFPVLQKDELPEIKIEVSVLTEPELINVNNAHEYVKKIDIGKDGLIIEKNMYSGLLLPQVATENNFTPPQFLNCLAQKAGLGFNAWKEEDSKIYKFQAYIFKEE
ncbi:AmmeMemoRadiSam system protein A [Candidatus Woesearchaeota archaeon]|nr:AmmeMemoRadiSam system protein A [Candidatus Woesearchaeota archaeon]